MVDAREDHRLVARGSPSPGDCGLGKGKADGVWWELRDSAVLEVLDAHPPSGHHCGGS